MNIPEESISFCREALVDIYDARSELAHAKINIHSNRFASSPYSLRDLESKIVELWKNSKNKSKSVVNLCIADKILRTRSYKTIRWTATVTFNSSDPFDIRYRTQFNPPVIEQAMSLYSYALESDRFLHVKLKGMASINNHSNVFSQFANQYWPQAELFKNGILFGGRRYFFLGGEIEKNEESESESEESSTSVILAWFYACDGPYTIQTIRNYFGHLSLLPSGKCNARIKLGFSLIFPFHISDDQVLVQPDITAASTGKILTDGCGFIAHDIALQLPYAISHGGFTLLREFDWPAPAIIQVRAVCREGLFKGCLLVTKDPNLCPPGKIIFRESMRKAYRFKNETVQYRDAVLGVVETFEHPSQLSRYGKHRKLSDFQTKLNRPLCLLLNYLNVKSQFFVEMVKNELEPWIQQYEEKYGSNRTSPNNRDSLSSSAYNSPTSVKSTIKYEERWHLYSLAKLFIQTEYMRSQQQHHQLFQTRSQQVAQPFPSSLEEPEEWKTMDEEECDFSTIGDNDGFQEELAQAKVAFATMYTKSPVSMMYYQRKETTLGENILQFLLAGVSLQDTYFQQLWQKLLKVQFSYMKKCHFTVSNGLYLVGAPDPYGILAPNEIYISFPGDRKCLDATCNYLLQYTGKVIVSRNPMHHPGDIRVFDAVRPAPLVEAFEIPTNGGVVVFSTQGSRAPADEMSGGDYDGDKFILLFDNNSQLVKSVQAIPPFEENAESKSSNNNKASEDEDWYVCPHRVIDDGCSLCKDSLGFEILQGLLCTSQTQYIGKYSNAWLAYSDANPLSKEALACGEIVRVALDAAKSGIKIPERPDLLRNAPYPEYLRPQKKILQTNSTTTSYQTPKKPTSAAASQSSTADYFSSPSYDSSQPTPSTQTVSTSILTSLNELIEIEENKYFDYLNSTNERYGLLFDWDMLLVEGDDVGNERIQLRMQQLCPSSTLAQAFQDVDLISYQPINDILDQFYPILQEFARELNEWNVHIQAYKEDFALLFRQKENRNTIKVEALLQKQLKLFADKVEVFYEEHRDLFGSVGIARQRLASLIYVSTYGMAKPSSFRNIGESSSSMVWPISYCWEICGHELRKNKTFARCRRKGVEPMNMDPAEIPYLR